MGRIAPGLQVIVCATLLAVLSLGCTGIVATADAGRAAAEMPAMAGSDKPSPPAYPCGEAQASLAATSRTSLAQQMEAGRQCFLATCSVCHQPTGLGLPLGIPMAIPPLAQSDYLMADRERSKRIVLTGLSGPVTVNGLTFNGLMPSHAFLHDDDLANILTYVRNSWGNSDRPVSAAEIRQARARLHGDVKK